LKEKEGRKSKMTEKKRLAKRDEIAALFNHTQHARQAHPKCIPQHPYQAPEAKALDT
jgi:hypothetical protein